MEKKDKIVKKKSVGSVLVIGGGIAGIQAALDLADSGYYVYMVEKKSAIGGVMAQLDKTFPTNDCSMCVISPKLVECGRHLNINLMTLSEIDSIAGNFGNFTVKIKREPRYIDIEKCTACGECATVCPINVPNLFDEKLRDRKAAFKLYPQGMPSAYTIDKIGTAPCKATCPAHVSIQGYIALINNSRYDEALKLFREDHPFPGVCGRVCHHPCEIECTRSSLDQSLAIRDLHRFLFDYEFKNSEGNLGDFSYDLKGEKVAIIGSGPSGLTAAVNLLKMGYNVTVFEKFSKPGGMMRYGIPEYRLPKKVLDYEIDIIKKMGIIIKCNAIFGKDITLDSLKADNYKACFLAVGLHGGRSLGIKNESALGVIQGVDFLRNIALGNKVNISDKVLVIGGGNVAIDVALTAKRMGSEKVTLVCLEKRSEMPAWDHEIEEAIQGGVEIINEFGPKELYINDEDCISGLQFRMCTKVFDSKGKFNPQYNEEICKIYNASTIIIAIGQSLYLKDFRNEKISISKMGGIEANISTLQTSLKWVFTGGDAFYGPKSVVDAVACGKKVALNIDSFLKGNNLEDIVTEKWEFVKPDVSGYNKEFNSRVPIRTLTSNECKNNFLEVVKGYNDSEAKLEASRCLKCGICSECYKCVDVCLAGAVDHKMTKEELTVNVGAIVLASGFVPFDPSKHKTYEYVNHPNIITSLEFERILSASGPYSGHMVRPSDDKEPDKIAWLQCVGSRDINMSDHSYCSSVCCMYTTKQTVIAKEHSTKPLDTAVFYMDMRTCGKDFEKYYMRAKEEKGVRYIRSKIHSIIPFENDNLMLRYVAENGEISEEFFDMVVLAVGLSPCEDVMKLSNIFDIKLNEHLYPFTNTFNPVQVSRKGIYVCGVIQEPKDIPQSVMEASAAAAEVGEILAGSRNTLTKIKKLPDEIDVSLLEPRIGVFVCNCGINIGGIANIDEIKKYSENLPNVVHVEDNLFTCSQDTQDNIKDIIKEKSLNRIVVASCSPRTHESLFQETIRDAGLNKYLFEMANIRDQNTWVHSNSPDKATKKAKDLIKMAVSKAFYIEPLHQLKLNLIRKVLIIGGGIAGLESALGIANSGFEVYLVEKNNKLGGIARNLRFTWKGELISDYLEDLESKVNRHSKINLFVNTEVVSTKGIIGNFVTTLLTSSKTIITTKVNHGAMIVATGGRESIPSEYFYGENSNVLTHLDFDKILIDKTKFSTSSNYSIAFIQCVGSRNDDRPYCSKVCCTHTLKSALLLKKYNSNIKVYVIYRDIRSYGFREELYRKSREVGVIFIKYDLINLPNVRALKDGLVISILDHVLQVRLEFNLNLLVLATAIIPNENKDLFELLKLPVNNEGFLVEAHAKLRPVDFSSEGIFVAGIAHYPKPLDETIAQAKAAVSRVMTVLSKENIMVGGAVAEVNSDKCAVCLTCVRTCPYNVPFIGKNGYAEIPAAGCQGCGMCVSECPGKAIQLKHFTDEQMFAKANVLFSVKA